MDKCNGRCAYCGEALVKGWHIDHVKPIVRGIESGKPAYPELDCLDNCVPSCPACNINKHSMTVEQFRDAIYGYVKSLDLRMVQYKMAKKYGLVAETKAMIVFYFETLK